MTTTTSRVDTIGSMTERIEVKLTDKTLAFLDACVEERGTSRDAVIESALEHYEGVVAEERDDDMVRRLLARPPVEGGRYDGPDGLRRWLEDHRPVTGDA